MAGERDLRLSITSRVHFLDEERVPKMLEGLEVLIQVWVARVMDTIDEVVEEEEEGALTQAEEGEGTNEVKKCYPSILIKWLFVCLCVCPEHFPRLSPTYVSQLPKS